MILITGGMGYIGSRVAKRFPGSYIIDHKANNRIDSETLDRILPHVNAVIHLAGTHYAFSADDCYSDLKAFIDLMHGMRLHNVNRLVLCSSASVYGSKVTSPVSEDHPINPDTPYGRYKFMCEQIANDYGMKVSILRPFNASGGLAKFIPSVKDGKVTVCGDGTAIRDFISVDDVADAFVKALEGPPGVYNIGSGVGYTLNEVFAMAGNVEVAFKPERPNDPKELVADISKASEVLGWSPKHTLKDILCE